VPIKKGKPELIETATDKGYAKRHQDGTLKDSVDVRAIARVGSEQ
jgi:hypothetical protein